MKNSQNSALPCRAVQISQIILNLLQNEDENALKLFFTDSGNGIPDSIRDKILQPFLTTKEVGKGTGLGLSISKGIMEEHDGELAIDSSCKNS